MAYEARPLRRQKVRYNDANDDCPLKTQLIVGGAKVTPASATITIYRPGNATALVGPVAMTVTGTLLTYAPLTTTVASWPVEQGYRADVVVTYGAVTYPIHLVFDVEKYPLVFGLTRDSLLALDPTILGMDHAGDEDFSEPIEAAHDDLQLMLESKATEDGQLLESMILDGSRIAIPARYYVLHLIYFNKDAERSDRYKNRFNELWASMLAGIKYDEDQDGEEDAKQGRVITTRFEM